MKYIKEYLCDKRTPSDEEIRECLEIVSKEDCVVKLTWFVRYNGWHNLLYIDYFLRHIQLPNHRCLTF